MPEISIAGQAIVLDHQCKLKEFMQDRIPPEEILFGRWMPAPAMHAAVVDNYEALTPPYPELPPIAVGELQWPTGASRYARALYFVDKATMYTIATTAWGMTTHIDDWVQIPLSWGADIKPVPIVLNGEELFTASMYPLPPYRVPGEDVDLFILPLVDQRFFLLNKPYEPLISEGHVPAWDTLFAQLASTLDDMVTGPTSSVSIDYGVPCEFAIKPGVSASSLLDCAALSVGLRVVMDPGTGRIRVISQGESVERWNSTLLKTTWVAGGSRGEAAIPSKLSIFCRKADQFSLICNDQERRDAIVPSEPSEDTPDTYTKLAHSAWIVDHRLWGNTIAAANDRETNYYVQRVAYDMESWLSAGSYYSFAGPINYIPNGYDDYFTIRIAEDKPGQYAFSCRVQELPTAFLPNLLLSQSPDIKIASPIEQFKVPEQDREGGAPGNNQSPGSPGIAHFPGSPSDMVLVAGIETDDAGKTITAYYRCGEGWQKIAGAAGNTTLAVFELTAPLNPPVSATESETAAAEILATTEPGLSAGAAITVTNAGRWRGFVGASGVAIKVSTGDSEQWWVIQLDQPGDVVAVLDNFTSSDDFGADPREARARIKTEPAPYVTSLYPFSFLPEIGTTVANPLKFAGESGDIAILKWDATFDEYFLANVIPGKQRVFWGEVHADTIYGLQPHVEVDPKKPASPGEMPATPVTVTDLFDVAQNAKKGDHCLVVWDPDRKDYVFAQSVHDATAFLGQMAQDWDSAPSLQNGWTNSIPPTFDVLLSYCYNGETPTPPEILDGTLNRDGRFRVENRWRWESGSLGEKVEIRWDQNTGVWYPLQRKFAAGGGAEVAVFQLLAPLSPSLGATANAEVLLTNAEGVSVGNTITVYNTGGYAGFVSNGARALGTAIKVSVGDENQWWAIQVQQPYLQVIAVLDAHPNNVEVDGNTGRFGADPRELWAKIQPGSIYGLSPYPFNLLHDSLNPSQWGPNGGLVANSLRLFGEAGDGVLLQYEASTASYGIVAVYPQRQREFWGNLLNPANLGLQPTLYVQFDAPNSGGSVPGAFGTIVAQDIFGIAGNGDVDDRVFVKWNAYEQQYIVTHCEHAPTKARAQIHEDFDGAPSVVKVTSVTGLDGNIFQMIAPSAFVEVQNRFRFPTGKRYDECELRYDKVAGEWYILQLLSRSGFDMRINPDGSSMQISRDGGKTWTNLATFDDCPSTTPPTP